ncbi:MAG: Gfo/Idh/MocA family oxidoreductase, partial [Clostridia bacterium]
MSNLIKIAVVGCGGIAQVHSNVLNELKEINIVAFCDIKPERAELLSQKYGGNVYDDFETMLESEEIDVVHICTPHYLHTPMAKKCSEKKIKVFSEKPPAITSEQWEEFKSIDTKIGVCFQNRYNGNVLKIKDLINSKKAGKILGARAFVTWTRDADYYTKSGWRGSLETEGGGALINQSIHTLDLLVYLIGTPVDCSSSIHNRHLKSVIEVEDTVEAYVKFKGENVADNMSALFYATTAYSTDSPVFIEIHCENMTLQANGAELVIIHKDGTKELVEIEETTTTLGK